MPSSTTDNEKIVAAELNLSSIATGSSNYTATELKEFQERFEKTSLGGFIAGMAAVASPSLGGTAAAAAGGSTRSNSKKKSDKTGIVCTDRLEMGDGKS